MPLSISPSGGSGLPTTGGTLTGALTVPAGAVATPSLKFTGAGSTTGIYSSASGTIDIAIAGVRRYWFDGTNLNTSGVGIQITNANFLASFGFFRTDTGGAISIGAADDVKIGRGGGAGVLQLGVDHATTATAQKIKAHDVAGGNGASLTIEGGGGGGDGALYLGSTTAHPVGFHGSAVAQATTSVSAASITPNSSNIADDSATWDGYTIGKVVTALREKGILA